MTLLYDKRYEDPHGWFSFTIDPTFFTTVRFFGRGSMAGTHAFVAMLDDSLALNRETAPQVRSLVDMTHLSGTPLRAQFLIGKWLFGHKTHVERVAIFGARMWERKIAQAVMTIARMDCVAFFKTEDEARRFLDAAKSP